jgi:hypothetical protein
MLSDIFVINLALNKVCVISVIIIFSFIFPEWYNTKLLADQTKHIGGPRVVNPYCSLHLLRRDRISQPHL